MEITFIHIIMAMAVGYIFWLWWCMDKLTTEFYNLRRDREEDWQKRMKHVVKILYTREEEIKKLKKENK